MNNNKNDKNIAEQMKRLIELINFHDELYYIKNYQEISDYEYDNLRKELMDLENSFPHLASIDSPSLKVGSEKKSKFNTLEHKLPMLSLNNAYTVQEVKRFYERVSKSIETDIEVIAETKVDGLSASIRYENRELKLALTRGDGITGEDITTNVKFIKGVKKKLPSTFPKELEIRGEIFMSKKTFSQLNKERKRLGKELFSTTRNAAAGSVRQIDPTITQSRELSFFGYTIICEKNSLGNNIQQIRNNLQSNGFDLNKPAKLCKNINEMLDFHQYVFQNRDQIDYDIDGIVYKVNSLKHHSTLGATNRYPRWALAHKFPSEVGYTKVKNVIFQVGRTGSITPVAILTPVIIGGVKISRATLHNEEEIKRLDLFIGDVVSVQRAGDVIPKITSVIKEKREGSNKQIQIPMVCPSCGYELKKEKGEAVIRCLNYYSCEEQLLNRLYHFVSRGAFNIDGLGNKVVNFFWKKGYIYNYSDIFKLEQKIANNLINLRDIDGWGEKSVYNLLKSITASRKISFDKFIYSLGIRHIGQGVSTILSKKFSSLDELIKTFQNKNKRNILNTDGIGEIIVNSLIDFFAIQKNIEEIIELRKFIEIKYHQTTINNVYNGKNFVITGSFKGISRTKIQEKIKLLGANTASTVNKKTDFLFVGNEPGSKLAKAKKLNIKLLYFEDLLKLLNT